MKCQNGAHRVLLIYSHLGAVSAAQLNLHASEERKHIEGYSLAGKREEGDTIDSIEQPRGAEPKGVVM